MMYAIEIFSPELDDLIQYLYAPYKDLGGNGSGDAIIVKVKALPIISESEGRRIDVKS